MMHPAIDDQAFYDILVGLFRTVRILAGESNDAQRRRNEMAVRALRAEAMLRNTQIERDYWQAQVRRQLAVKARHREKERAAALQRAAKPPRLTTGAHVDAKRQQRGMLPRYTKKAKTR